MINCEGCATAGDDSAHKDDKNDDKKEDKPKVKKEEVQDIKVYEENLKKEFEKALEKLEVRILPLGSDRDRRTYWLLNTRDSRIFVHDPMYDAAATEEQGAEMGMGWAEAPVGKAERDSRSKVEGVSKAERGSRSPIETPLAVEAQGVGKGLLAGTAQAQDREKGADVEMEAAGKETSEGNEGAGRGGNARAATNWRVWPGAPPGARPGIPFWGGGPSETWGFYERIDQVDALIACLNPSVYWMHARACMH